MYILLYLLPLECFSLQFPLPLPCVICILLNMKGTKDADEEIGIYEVQSFRGLPCKLGDLSSIPRTNMKNLCAVECICDPSTCNPCG